MPSGTLRIAKTLAIILKLYFGVLIQLNYEKISCYYSCVNYNFM